MARETVKSTVSPRMSDADASSFSKLLETKPSIDEIRQDMRSRTVVSSNSVATAFVAAEAGAIKSSMYYVAPNPLSKDHTNEISTTAIRVPNKNTSPRFASGSVSARGIICDAAYSVCRTEDKGRLSVSLGSVDAETDSSGSLTNDTLGHLASTSIGEGPISRENSENLIGICKSPTARPLLDSKGILQLFRIVQEVLAFANVMDEGRTRAIEEVNRLRSQKDNLESMLQSSCSREQTNLAEAQKQRSSLAHWQERFTELKTHFEGNLSRLVESKQDLTSKLAKSATELRHYQEEIERLRVDRDRQQEQLANMQDVRETLAKIRMQKEESQAEVEALRHDNLQLQNRVNEVASERNQFQGRVDELEKSSLPFPQNDSPFDLTCRKSQEIRAEAHKLLRSEELNGRVSVFNDDSIAYMKENFRDSPEEMKNEQYEALLDQYKKEAMDRKKMEQYCQVLVGELDRYALKYDAPNGEE